MDVSFVLTSTPETLLVADTLPIEYTRDTTLLVADTVAIDDNTSTPETLLVAETLAIATVTTCLWPPGLVTAPCTMVPTTALVLFAVSYR